MKRAFLFCLLVLVLGAGILLARIQSPSPSTSVFASVFKVPFAAVHTAWSWVAGLGIYPRLRAENAQLRHEITELSFQLSRLRDAAVEIDSLRRLLKLREEINVPGVAASVVAFDPSPYSNSFWIDRGEEDGIKCGAPVLAYTGLVGSVVQAGARTSQVLMLTDPNQRVGALIRRTGEQGVAAGTLGKNLRLKYLGPESEAIPGDLVVTSGAGGRIPKGLVIGFLAAEPVKPDRQAERETVLQPAVDLDRVQDVWVVLR
ncbi:MAG: rod shape-determining protein MreC [Candidatus Omnitrophica bacterium]|nr:rod shape-determining protein MreC [Candidatus Omnitrophota bacterium]